MGKGIRLLFFCIEKLIGIYGRFLPCLSRKEQVNFLRRLLVRLSIRLSQGEREKLFSQICGMFFDQLPQKEKIKCLPRFVEKSSEEASSKNKVRMFSQFYERCLARLSEKEKARILPAFYERSLAQLSEKEKARIFPYFHEIFLSSHQNVMRRAELQHALLNDPFVIETKAGSIKFSCIGVKSLKRARALLTKEPGTLEWIERFEPDCVFWDVGANIGMYSLYAAKLGARVLAFEPGGINHFMLTVNAELNGLDERIDAFLLGFSDRSGICHLGISQLSPAETFNFEEQTNRFGFVQACPVYSVDDFIDKFSPPFPNYMKIDVEELGDATIHGAQKTLLNPEFRGLQIELDDKIPSSRDSIKYLEDCGFRVIRRNAKGQSTIGDYVFSRERPK